MDKKVLVIFSFLFLNSYQNFAADNFIISKEDAALKKLSKNQLKENIGGEMKSALHNCSELSKQIGKVQIELAQVQQQLFDKIAELIDNESPFKRAGRGTLSNTYKIINGVKRELDNQVATVKRLSMQINKDECLKKRNA